jgi:hypothetical protein
MRKFPVAIFFLLVITMGCRTSEAVYNKREFRRSKIIATYSTMANELQDDYLVLKENNYFKFYQTIWMVATIKLGPFTGTYTQSNDTIFLNWMGVNPQEIRPFLSGRCIIDSSADEIWFLDQFSDIRIKSLALIRKK